MPGPRLRGRTRTAFTPRLLNSNNTECATPRRGAGVMQISRGALLADAVGEPRVDNGGRLAFTVFLVQEL